MFKIGMHYYKGDVRSLGQSGEDSIIWLQRFQRAMFSRQLECAQGRARLNSHVGEMSEGTSASAGQSMMSAGGVAADVIVGLSGERDDLAGGIAGGGSGEDEGCNDQSDVRFCPFCSL
jgi:hypothetical protein